MLASGAVVLSGPILRGWHIHTIRTGSAVEARDALIALTDDGTFGPRADERMTLPRDAGERLVDLLEDDVAFREWANAALLGKEPGASAVGWLLAERHRFRLEKRRASGQ